MTRLNDGPCLLKQTGRDDRFECSVSPDPHLLRVIDTFVLQFEGASIVDVCTNVFRVDQHLMDCRACPRTPIFSQDAASIQQFHDLLFLVSFSDEQIVNVTDSLNFSFRSRDQDDPIGLQALSLASAQQTLRIQITVDQLPSQTISRWSSLAESQFDEAALTCKYLDR